MHAPVLLPPYGATKHPASPPARAFALTLQARLWFLDKKWSYPGGFTAEKEVQRRRVLAAWIRENLLALGPTFIKVRRVPAAQHAQLSANRTTRPPPAVPIMSLRS